MKDGCVVAVDVREGQMDVMYAAAALMEAQRKPKISSGCKAKALLYRRHTEGKAVRRRLGSSSSSSAHHRSGLGVAAKHFRWPVCSRGGRQPRPLHSSNVTAAKLSSPTSCPRTYVTLPTRHPLGFVSLSHATRGQCLDLPSTPTHTTAAHSSTRACSPSPSPLPTSSPAIMDNVRRFFYGPTPEEQKRKCTTLLNSNKRKLDRDIASLRTTEAKTRSLIVAASKRAQKAPPGSATATQAASETRIFAREMVRVRKQAARLHTSKATLASVGMQVQEAFAVRRIEGSLRASTAIMKDVNSLVRLPELTGTMRELSQELVRAGIIEEMVSDSLDSEGLEDFEDEEVEGEVDKVLGEGSRKSETLVHGGFGNCIWHGVLASGAQSIRHRRGSAVGIPICSSKSSASVSCPAIAVRPPSPRSRTPGTGTPPDSRPTAPTRPQPPPAPSSPRPPPPRTPRTARPTPSPRARGTPAASPDAGTTRPASPPAGRPRRPARSPQTPSTPRAPPPRRPRAAAAHSPSRAPADRCPAPACRGPPGCARRPPARGSPARTPRTAAAGEFRAAVGLQHGVGAEGVFVLGVDEQAVHVEEASADGRRRGTAGCGGSGGGIVAAVGGSVWSVTEGGSGRFGVGSRGVRGRGGGRTKTWFIDGRHTGCVLGSLAVDVAGNGMSGAGQHGDGGAEDITVDQSEQSFLASSTVAVMTSSALLGANDLGCVGQPVTLSRQAILA
nr:vacuolar protein-sorting-associated protein 24 [Quercus suber]